MQKYIKLLIFIPLVFFVGCSDETTFTHPNDEIVAIVNEEEITIKDLRILYNDEQALNRLDATIKATLVMQEVERLGLDISADMQEDIEMRKQLLTKDTENEALQANRKFAESQAEKFDMEMEDYYEEYVTITAKINASMVGYVHEKLGPPENHNEETIEDYNKKANELLDELVKEHEDDIEILLE